MQQNINMGYKYFISFILLLFVCLLTKAQTGIGTTTPNASAKLDVYATNKGFLPPRVTLTSTTDATTIVLPAEGLLVYNLGSVGLQAGYYYWNGVSWATIATASSSGNGVTAMDMVKLYGEAYSIVSGKIAHADGYSFTVPVSGRYLIDFASSGYANSATFTMTFKVRQGTSDLATDAQTSSNNTVHVEYNGKVEVNLQAGVNYNVIVLSTGVRNNADYDRVYYKLVAGNLPVTGQTVEYGIARFTGSDGGSMSNGALVAFDATAAGNLTWSGNKFTLKANKTYELESSLAIYLSSGGVGGRFQIYDYTNNTALASGLFMSQNGSGTNNPNANTPMKGIVTPATDIQVGIRLLDSYGPAGPGIIGSTSYVGAYASPNASYFMAKQIGSSAIINPWTLSGNNTYNTTGNVGIGNNAPTTTLDVTGTGKFSTSIINSGNRTYFGKDGVNMHWMGTTDAVSEPNNLAYGFESNGTSIQSHKWYTGGVQKMQLASSGKLALGTATPGTSLHIENGNTFGSDPSSTTSPSLYIFNNNNASTTAHSSLAIRTNGSGGGNPYLSFDINGVRGFSMGIDNADGDKFKIHNNWNLNNNVTPVLTITTDNWVGIGTTNPAAPLHVATSASQYVNSYGYLNTGGASTYTLNGNTSYSIQADQRIRAPEFNSISDVRIKKDILKLNTAKQLAVLNQLNPVHYAYIDQLVNGNKNKTGFIAQEVEQVNLQFVNQSPNFIPSFFALAKSATIVNDLLQVTTDKPHGFIKGDLVKFFAEGKKEIVLTIESISGLQTFLVKGWNESIENVFIYGKKVNDFRAIDFDQITALSVAAIQELSKQIENLKIENTNLKKEMVDKIQAKQAELEARLLKLEKKSNH